MQSWAALQMPFKHQDKGINTEVVALDVNSSQHPCHQEVASSSGEENFLSLQPNGCNSCTLCMAFGFFSFDAFIGQMPFSVSFKTNDVRFVSHDVLALNKPPIL